MVFDYTAHRSGSLLIDGEGKVSATPYLSQWIETKKIDSLSKNK
jgi:hypothetical protein